MLRAARLDERLVKRVGCHSGVAPRPQAPNRLDMPDDRTAAREDRAREDRGGQVAVIFAAWRTRVDEAGYAAAATAMGALAATQPGYCGIDAARGDDGFGVTVSYWADEASAVAWREHPEHAAVREAGRGRWYDRYDLHVAHVSHSYGWRRTGEGQA